MKYGISRAPAAAGNFQVQDSSCTNKNKLIGWHSIQATGHVLNGTARPLTFTSLSIPNSIREGEMRTTQNCIESGGRKLSCESENINWICCHWWGASWVVVFLLCCNLPPPSHLTLFLACLTWCRPPEGSPDRITCLKTCVPAMPPLLPTPVHLWLPIMADVWGGIKNPAYSLTRTAVVILWAVCPL